MHEQDRIERIAAFEAERETINVLSDELNRVPRWIPASSFKASLIRVQKILDDLYERLEAKPVIAVVGPSGSGKSTLVNALTGRDDTVKVGNTRPTTRDISAVVQTTADAQQLLDRLDHHDLNVVIQPALRLRHAVILDTPDTDSMECVQYRSLLERTLGLSDVLICVFDASNPKRKDNIRALAEWVGLFPGKNIFLVLNRSDRIPKDQLTQVVADFQKHISDAKSWDRDFKQSFCVSARDRLKQPEWPAEEKPLHGRNDFDKLVTEIDELGGGSFFVDQRIARAQELRAAMQSSIRKCVGNQREELQSLQKDIRHLEDDIAKCWLNMLFDVSGADTNTIQPLLWGAVTRRWWGPVGLAAAFFRRLILFATPFSMLNSLNPAKVFMALVRSVRSLAGSDKAESDLAANLGVSTVDDGCLDARIKFQQEWPTIAEHLVKSGFNPVVRDITNLGDFAVMNVSRELWSGALQRVVERSADRLSGTILQILLNAPVLIGIFGAGYFLVRDFIYHTFLPLNFHLHVLSLILLLWLLSAWFLQYLVQRSIKRIPLDALKEAEKRASEAVESGITHDQDSVLTELGRLLLLAEGSASSTTVP